jgi:P22 coat protein - gene protein 5
MMPNAFTKDLEIMFENLIENFDAACVMSRAVETSYPDATSMQRANDVFYRPQSYRTAIQTGIDISGGSSTDLIQRQVPTTFRTPDNVRYELNFLQARDPMHYERAGKAAALDLAANIEANLLSTVALQSAIVVKKVGALTWDDGATAEALMLSRGVPAGRSRKMFLNPFDYKDIAKDLGNRAYIGDLAKDAYIRSQVPAIATFETFRTDTQYNLAAIGTVSGTTINGNQSFTPSAMTGDLPTDNRRMTLVVQGANIANTKNGDTFTIANVNAVHNIDKTDTGQLMTFRIISGAGTVNLVITPAIITTGPYKNVTTQAATGAAVTFLNTVTKPVNAFFADGAVTLDFGDISVNSDQGVKWMKARTKQGVPIAMGYSQGLLTGVTTVRCVTRYATTVLDPEQCGIIIANQS